MAACAADLTGKRQPSPATARWRERRRMSLFELEPTAAAWRKALAGLPPLAHDPAGGR
jgi:hypothetical protein